MRRVETEQREPVIAGEVGCAYGAVVVEYVDEETFGDAFGDTKTSADAFEGMEDVAVLRSLDALGVDNDAAGCYGALNRK